MRWPLQFRGTNRVRSMQNHHGPGGSTLRHGWALVRMNAHAPVWSLYRYQPDGGWTRWEVAFLWGRRRDTLHPGAFRRLKLPWKADA